MIIHLQHQLQVEAKQEPTNFDAEVRAPEKMVGEAMLGAEMEIVDEEPAKVDDDRVKYQKFRKELDVHRKRFQVICKTCSIKIEKRKN